MGIRNWATIMCWLVGIGGFVTAITGESIIDVEPAWVGIPIGLVCLVGAFFLTRRPKWCKECHKWFCMVKGEKECVAEEQISMSVEVKEKNRIGEVTGTREQYIPGTRSYYQTPFTCKHCRAVRYVAKMC